MSHLGAQSVAEYSRLKFEEKFMAAKETINEEKMREAQKEGRRSFSFPVYTVSTKQTFDKDKKELPTKYMFVEAERFFDARAFACRFLGVPEVNISLEVIDDGNKPIPRWQVQWTGGAANGDSTLRTQARYIECREHENPGSEPKWRDVRDL